MVLGDPSERVICPSQGRDSQGENPCLRVSRTVEGCQWGKGRLLQKEPRDWEGQHHFWPPVVKSTAELCVCKLACCLEKRPFSCLSLPSQLPVTILHKWTRKQEVGSHSKEWGTVTLWPQKSGVPLRQCLFLSCNIVSEEVFLSGCAPAWVIPVYSQHLSVFGVIRRQDDAAPVCRRPWEEHLSSSDRKKNIPKSKRDSECMNTLIFSSHFRPTRKRMCAVSLFGPYEEEEI